MWFRVCGSLAVLWAQIPVAASWTFVTGLPSNWRPTDFLDARRFVAIMSIVGLSLVLVQLAISCRTVAVSRALVVGVLIAASLCTLSMAGTTNLLPNGDPDTGVGASPPVAAALAFLFYAGVGIGLFGTPAAVLAVTALALRTRIRTTPVE